MSLLRLLLGFGIWSVAASSGFSQSLVIDPGFPSYTPPFFPYIFNGTINVQGTLILQAGAMAPAQVNVVVKKGTTEKPLTADYDPVSKKFGKWSGGVIVPITTASFGSGTYTVYAYTSYPIANPTPPPATVNFPLISGYITLVVP